MRILIRGEDEALARSVLQGLEGEPYSGDVLPDGEPARSAAAEFEYDGLILDLNLPKLDGVSVFGAGSDAAYSCRRPGAGSAAHCLDIPHVGQDLVAKIRAVAGLRSSIQTMFSPESLFRRPTRAWGISTGGPKALKEILPLFPRDLSFPVTCLSP